jgi:nitrite reductase/ring-hydroxylating ferredoxin subunit
MNHPEVEICRLSEIPDPGAKEFTLGEGEEARDGFVVHRGGAVHAYVNSCPHTGAPLNWAPGRFLTKRGDLIMCGVHGAIFRIDDGFCLEGPCKGRELHPLPVRVEDGWVIVGGEE